MNDRASSGIKLSSLHFHLMNPEVHFREMMAAYPAILSFPCPKNCLFKQFYSARAVVLAGGTMQPFDHVTNQLFADNQSKILILW
jgi:Rad3-related DNA helicase